MEYLARLVEAGVDFQYLLLGIRSNAEETMICLDPDVMDRAMLLADRISRDEKGRLLDLELRNALMKQVFLAVSKKHDDEIDWENLELKVRT